MLVKDVLRLVPYNEIVYLVDTETDTTFDQSARAFKTPFLPDLVEDIYDCAVDYIGSMVMRSGEYIGKDVLIIGYHYASFN